MELQTVAQKENSMAARMATMKVDSLVVTLERRRMFGSVQMKAGH